MAAVSGIPTLDLILGGGLPKSPNIVISGNQQDVYLFSLQLIWTRLNAGDLCLYGTISRSREEVIADLDSKNRDISLFIKRRELRVVDYLALAEDRPGKPKERLSILFSMSIDTLHPENFYQVFLREFSNMRQRRLNRKFFAIFDSVDRMITLMGLENTLRFAEMVFNTLGGSSNIGIALVNNETISEEVLEAVKAASSVFIELRQEQKDEKVNRMLRVVKPESSSLALHWAPWYY